MARTPEAVRSGAVVSVQRTLDILEMLENCPMAPVLSEISAVLKIPEATVHRICQTLAAKGFINRDPASLRYSLGLKVATLAPAVLDRLPERRESLGTIQRLAEVNGLNVNVGVLYGNDVMYVARVDGPELPKGYCLPGRRVPAHLTAMGKILLACLPNDRLEGWLHGATLFSATGCSITEPGRLREVLMQAMEQRYAQDEEELTIGNRCLAVPVRNGRGQVVASLSISGPIVRFNSDLRQAHLQRLWECASEISLRLGYIS